MIVRCNILLLRCNIVAISCVLHAIARRTDVKKMSLSAAAAVLALTAATSSFAAELPTYEKAGLPISAVQLQVLGAANVRERSPVATSAASPHQRSVLAARRKLNTATDAAITTGAGH
jgi:hypothetical protein